MKKIFRTMREAFEAVIDVLDVFNPVWVSNVPMADAVDVFKASVVDIDNKVAIQ